MARELLRIVGRVVSRSVTPMTMAVVTVALPVMGSQDQPKAKPAVSQSAKKSATGPSSPKSSSKVAARDGLPVTERIPDPLWQPKPGDKVAVPVDKTPAATSYAAFDHYQAARAAGDGLGVDSLIASKQVVTLAKGVNVLIVRDHAARDLGPSRTISAGAMANAMVHARPAEKPTEPLEVRVLDGEQANRMIFVARTDVAKLIERRILPQLAIGDRAIVAPPSTIIARSTDSLYIHRNALRYRDDPEWHSDATIARLYRDGSIVKLDDGAKVTVLGIEDEFCRVKVTVARRLAGHVGFVPMGDLIPVQP